MTKFSNKLKKNPVFGPFWAHFPNFGGKKFFLEYPALSNTTWHGILPPCQNLEKINNTIPRKRLDRSKDRRTDGQTLFYRTLSAIARGPISEYLNENNNIKPSTKYKRRLSNSKYSKHLVKESSATKEVIQRHEHKLIQSYQFPKTPY